MNDKYAEFGRRRVAGATLVAAALFIVVQAIDPITAVAQQAAPRAANLTCFVRGFPHPVSPTDGVIFKGSDAWANVGITRTFGGIVMKLALVNPAAPNRPLDILEPRSAAGGAWQTSMGMADEANNRIVHYNQAAGNSASMWGFESPYKISPATGIVQQEWLPLFSNDYRSGLSFAGPDTKTSPCYNNSLRLGDGKTSLIPSLIPSNGKEILRLTSTYSVRAAGQQNWKWFDVDQALYITLGAARAGNLRLYLSQAGTSVIGPIELAGPPPLFLRGKVRTVLGDSEDWFIGTLPTSYVLLVFDVAGEKIGMAIHGQGTQTLTEELRYRPHAFCPQDRDDCGSVQIHTTIASSRFDAKTKTAFKDGEVTDYVAQYDIAPAAQLAAEGFGGEGAASKP